VGHQQIERLKTSPEPLVSNWLMSLFGFLPACIGRPLWHSAAYKVSVSGLHNLVFFFFILQVRDFVLEARSVELITGSSCCTPSPQYQMCPAPNTCARLTAPKLTSSYSLWRPTATLGILFALVCQSANMSWCTKIVIQFLLSVAFSVSYADRVSFGYASDPRLIKDPQIVTELFAEEMTRLDVALNNAHATK
jgi:hypothetical protein